MYPGAKAVMEAAQKTATQRRVAEAVIRKTTVDQIAKTAKKTAEKVEEDTAAVGITEKMFDISYAASLNRLRGLLPNENIATIEDAAKIADRLITEAKLGDRAVTQAKLGPGAVTVTKVSDNSISTPKLRAGAVSANTIAAGAVRTNKLAANAVTADKVAADQIVSRHVAAGAITATAIAALDVNGVNAVFKDASIRAAKIVSLTADKIKSGSIRATIIRLGTDGVLKAGRTTLSSSGVSLQPEPNAGGSPSQNIDHKISAGNWAAMGFFNNPNGSYRGITLRADGISNVRGRINIIATPDGTDDADSARVYLLPGTSGGDSGLVRLERDVSVERNLRVNGAIEADLGVGVFTLSPNQRRTFVKTGGFGGVPRLVFVQTKGTDGRWYPSTNGGQAEFSVNSTSISIRNNLDRSADFRAFVYR